MLLGFSYVIPYHIPYLSVGLLDVVLSYSALLYPTLTALHKLFVGVHQDAVENRQSRPLHQITNVQQRTTSSSLRTVQQRTRSLLCTRSPGS